jgi:hypothetical protein
LENNIQKVSGKILRSEITLYPESIDTPYLIFENREKNE